MNIHLILVPYDSARRGERMGAGPEHLVAAGLAEHLARGGHHVHHDTIEPVAANWRAEIGTAFELASAVSVAVRAARATGAFPIVLSGNCFAALGVVAALGAGSGVTWFDAHADFNTPETTTSGFLDGMALATLTGRCWTALSRQVPGFVPVADANVWLLGARDLDPAEADALAGAAIRRIPASAIDATMGSRVANELRGPEELYVHLDLDVLDRAAGRVNAYAAGGGASAAMLEACCRSLGEHAPVSALTVSAYDPAWDQDGRVCRAAFGAIAALLAGRRDRGRSIAQRSA